MTTPHVLDIAGREAFRKDMIAEMKRLGLQVDEGADFDSVRAAYAVRHESRQLQRSTPVVEKRSAAAAHMDAEDRERKDAAAPVLRGSYRKKSKSE